MPVTVSETETQRLLNDLLHKVVDPMEQVIQATLQQGLFCRLTPPSGQVPMAYLDVFPDPSDPVSAQFMVRREPEGWFVHRLMYTRNMEGLQRMPVAPLTFETLPDATFFLGLLQDFIHHEVTVGSLNFD